MVLELRLAEVDQLARFDRLAAGLFGAGGVEQRDHVFVHLLRNIGRVARTAQRRFALALRTEQLQDRKSVEKGKSVYDRVDLGGGLSLKQTTRCRKIKNNPDK